MRSALAVTAFSISDSISEKALLCIDGRSHRDGAL
jgi:hypothetical protein